MRASGRRYRGGLWSASIKRFTSYDGTAIAFGVNGTGPAVLLHHGFASNSGTNWVRPKLASALVDSGRTVVLVDARGHGESDKPHEPAAYAGDAMARDVRSLLDHLELASVDVVGYSMGSLVALELGCIEPRVRSLVLGGIGMPQLTGPVDQLGLRLAEGLAAPDRSSITDPTVLAFRNFAEATGADLLALAAFQRSRRPFTDLDWLRRIQVGTLVLNGDRDTLAGSPDDLARAIPGAISRVVPGDHLSAVARPEFRQAIEEFLSGTGTPPR